MSQQISVITSDEQITRVQPKKLISISSGPMSEGMIPSVSNNKEKRKTNNSTEHICTFSVCLMFIGVPIIFIGFLVLTLFPPIAIILILIGVLASVSGTILVILSGIIMLISRKSSKTKTTDVYEDIQTPEIIIDDTLYTENFEDNLCEESQDMGSGQGLSELPNMEKLDPVQWSNYPEAQNPKSYLQSFGELPKVLQSPDIRPTSSKRNRSHKKSKKTSKKVKRQFSKLKGMGSKQKTISQTSLNHDFSDEIKDDSDSSLSSSSNDSSPAVVQKRSYHEISANQFGTNHNNQSVVTIENTGQYTSDDLNDIEEEVLNSSADNIDADCSHSNNQSNEETDDRISDKQNFRISDKHANNEHKNYNSNGINKTGILPDDCTDSIDLNDTKETIKDNRSDKNDTEFEEYSDLWNTIRSVKTERITKA